MGVLDKITFWKKKDDFSDLGGDFGKDMPLGGDFGSSMNAQGFPDPSSGFDSQPSFGGSNPYPQSPSYPSPFGQSQTSSQSSPQSSQFSQPQTFSQAPSYSSPSYSSAPYQPAGSDPNYINSKSLEVISSKLDALRAAIDSMNARLSNIERIAGQEEEGRRRRYY